MLIAYNLVTEFVHFYLSDNKKTSQNGYTFVFKTFTSVWTNSEHMHNSNIIDSEQINNQTFLQKALISRINGQAFGSGLTNNTDDSIIKAACLAVAQITLC